MMCLIPNFIDLRLQKVICYLPPLVWKEQLAFDKKKKKKKKKKGCHERGCRASSSFWFVFFFFFVPFWSVSSLHHPGITISFRCQIKILAVFFFFFNKNNLNFRGCQFAFLKSGEKRKVEFVVLKSLENLFFTLRFCNTENGRDSMASAMSGRQVMVIFFHFPIFAPRCTQQKFSCIQKKEYIRSKLPVAEINPSQSSNSGEWDLSAGNKWRSSLLACPDSFDNHDSVFGGGESPFAPDRESNERTGNYHKRGSQVCKQSSFPFCASWNRYHRKTRKLLFKFVHLEQYCFVLSKTKNDPVNTCGERTNLPFCFRSTKAGQVWTRMKS